MPYAYAVSAELNPLLSVRGRPVFVSGFGMTLASATVAPSTNWNALLRLLNELAQKKAEIQHALEQNPLVEETELINQLAILLKDPSSLTNVLDAILNDPGKLTDAEAALKGLCYLEALLEFVSLHDPNMKPATREKLKRYREKVKELKDRLEKAQDRQSKLPEVIEALKGLNDEFKNEAGDPLGYLARLLKDKLLEKLKEMLKKKLGEKAAGAIVSIISDLINFGALIEDLIDLHNICLQYNALLLAGIANDPTGTTEPSRLFTSKIPPADLDCTSITLSYKKMCWKPKSGGDPNEGDWQISDVPFDDGDTSKTRNAADINQGTAPDGRICLQLATVLDQQSLVCPPGEGPCIVFAEATHNCPGKAQKTYRLFAGVIRCP